jgi:hypothetical protein
LGSDSSIPAAVISRATPGTSAEACAAPDGHCVTCGDEGIAMWVLTADGTSGNAICTDADRARHEVAVDLVGAVAPGDELLVHAGVAIRHLGPQA